MEQTQYVVMQKTNDFPSGLKTAQEISEYIVDISESRIIDLADSGYLPHYRIDGGSPRFKQSEVKQWLSNNLMARCSGRSMPDAIRVVIAAPEVIDKPPIAICNIPGLQQIPKHGYQPGVYFLCKGQGVVYVGQSVAPSARVSTHAGDKSKDFDRVYLLPVPMSDLNDVEAAFIHHLLPIQQGGIKSGKEKPTSPSMSAPKDYILRSVGCEV